MVSYESLASLRLHTVLTAAFSHYDGWHLFSNMFALYFFGSDVGRLFGGRRVRCIGSSTSFAALQSYVRSAKAALLLRIDMLIWAANDGAVTWSPPVSQNLQSPELVRVLPCLTTCMAMQLIQMYVVGAVVGSLAHVGAQLWQARNTGRPWHHNLFLTGMQKLA